MTGKRYCADNMAVNEWILSSFTAHTQHLLKGLQAADSDQRPTAEEVLRCRLCVATPFSWRHRGERRGRGSRDRGLGAERPREGRVEQAVSECGQDLRRSTPGQLCTMMKAYIVLFVFICNSSLVCIFQHNL